MNKLLVIIFLGLSIPIFAQTNTWDGSTDGDWHKACNWSLNLIPTCSHDVVIPTVGTTYPTVTVTAHSKSLSITSAASNALTINSTVGGILYIGSGGGSCAGTATDNGGCDCSNLTFLYSSGGPDGYPACDASGPCGTNCSELTNCTTCLTPVLCESIDCDTPCGSDCGGFAIYRYAP